MTQPSAANAKVVDKSNNPQIQDRQAAVTALTYVGTPTTQIQYSFFTPENNALSSLNAKLVEILDVMRYHGLIAGGTQVTAAASKFVDKSNNPQLGLRQAAITALTDNSGGTPGTALDYNPGLNWQDDMASMGRDINLVLDALEYHGLIAGGTQVTEAVSRFVDKANNPQLGVRQTAIADLTDNVGGTISDTIAASTDGSYADDVASVAAKLNVIIERLELHGLTADN